MYYLYIYISMQVFCYALSANDGTEWRQRIQSEAEHFVDVSAMSSDSIAKMINEDKIHILVNLNGYTKVGTSYSMIYFLCIQTIVQIVVTKLALFYFFTAGVVTDPFFSCWNCNFILILHDVALLVIFQGARNEIFAMQPAPIQVSYMGFPGTTGATYIDYLVTDEVRY